jgi:8-oxo-dGTP pyrophosphatase MutT (NUDIX family)
VVPIVDGGDEAAVLITKRPFTMRHHPGDWVFPGGGVDPGRDASPLEAALRELGEELGVAGRDVELLGHLTTYGPFVTGFLLHVFVAVVTIPLERLAPNPHEVLEVGLYPLSAFMGEGRRFTGPIPEEHRAGPALDSPEDGRPGAAKTTEFYLLRDEEYLWGTQGEIMSDLLHRLREGAS